MRQRPLIFNETAFLRGFSKVKRLRAVLLLSVAVAATMGAKGKAANEAIDKIFDGRVSATQTVLVVRLSDGKTLYEKDPDVLLAPASVTKVVTAAAVLSRFTPVHTFKTPLFHTGARKNEKVLGDLIVVGDGDPYLVSEKLWQMAADLKNMGIREFTGDLIVDNTLFGDEGRDESRQAGLKSSTNAYDAPVSALGINFNTFAVAVAPADAAGKPALVSIDPYPLRGVIVDNDVKTSKGRGTKSLAVKRVSSGGKDGEKLVASGTIATDLPIQKIYRSVGDYAHVSGEYVKAFLKQEGVIVRGVVKEGRRPANATLLYEIESYDLRKIVAGLMNFSNNYVADTLVKRLGAAYPKKGAPESPGSGTFANGMAAITDFLRKDVGIKSDFTLNNGSGLDSDNRLSARQITDVLAFMEHHMEVFPEFLGALPATGWDGTLKKRFGKAETESLKGLVRAKTGTLTEPVSVAGLAGYFRHPKHGLVAFAILENGKPNADQPAITDLRDRQDKVVVAFMNEI